MHFVTFHHHWLLSSYWHKFLYHNEAKSSPVAMKNFRKYQITINSMEKKIYISASSRKHHVNITSVMKTKVCKTKNILWLFACYVDLHECRHQKPEQRGLQVAWGQETSPLPRVFAKWAECGTAVGVCVCVLPGKRAYQHTAHIDWKIGRKKVRRAKPGNLQNQRASFDVCLHSIQCCWKASCWTVVVERNTWNWSRR